MNGFTRSFIQNVPVDAFIKGSAYQRAFGLKYGTAMAGNALDVVVEKTLNMTILFLYLEEEVIQHGILNCYAKNAIEAKEIG